jgi:hypothetical protein
MKPETVLQSYFRAKDGNQPQLMRKSQQTLCAFDVKAPGCCSPRFPGRAHHGSPGRFGETFDNVRSSILIGPRRASRSSHATGWLE